MNQDNNPTTVALAVHKNIIGIFHKQPLGDEQVISSSIRPEYDILTLETVDYMEMVPTIQQFMPFIKVIMPRELDYKIRQHLDYYDSQDLSEYAKAN